MMKRHPSPIGRKIIPWWGYPNWKGGIVVGAPFVTVFPHGRFLDLATAGHVGRDRPPAGEQTNGMGSASEDVQTLMASAGGPGAMKCPNSVAAESRLLGG